MEWFLLTGQPQTGKTTVINKTIENINEEFNKDNNKHTALEIRGFLTDEKVNKKNGQRIGFDLRTIPDNKSMTFANKTIKTKFKTGKYFVDPSVLDTFGVDSISNSNNSVYIIDEIGRMEMHSEKFQQRIKDMLNDKKTIVIGTVAAPRYGHVVPLAEAIKKNPRVHVYHIKKSTRDDVLLQFKNDVINYLKKNAHKLLIQHQLKNNDKKRKR